MQYRDERKRLVELIVNNRVDEESFLPFAKKAAVAAPPEMLNRWKTRFYAKVDMDYPVNPKLLNRFCIGADPEFIFTNKVDDIPYDPDDPHYVYAQQFGMNTLEAFGADLNGRLAELRVYPHRFVLNVVASILDTLRWMNEAYPKTYQYQWCAPAIKARDGIGGHVHIGRRRKDTNEFVKSLDSLVKILSSTNIVDGAGEAKRRADTKYGKPGDIRPQPHGIEYRTMPTWLNSPWSAYLTLTLAKLCIFHPLSAARLSRTPENNFLIIKNLLMAFSGLDDDARIALAAWERMGPPQYVACDFKKNWGIEKPIVHGIGRHTHYFPPIISPEEKSVKELFDFFVKGNPITYRFLKATWEPFKLSEVMNKIMIQEHIAGLPEIAQGLIAYKTKLGFRGSLNANQIEISTPSSFVINPKDIKTYLVSIGSPITSARVFQSPDGEGITIFMPSNIQVEYLVNKDIVQDIRRLLTESGLFPVSKYNKLKESIPQMNKCLMVAKKKEAPKMLGNLVLAVEGNR